MLLTEEQALATNRRLLLDGAALLDVRAPAEFAKGHLPGAYNLPILNDEERHKVGLCYKQQGNDAATKLGHKLIAGELREQRIAAWLDFLHANPDAVIQCWRGGQRSDITRQWLAERGENVPVAQGGYKALRRILLDVFAAISSQHRLVRIGGRTGVAKTRLVNAVAGGIDLEHHARHRGSSFGRRLAKSPSQQLFENALGIDILRKSFNAPEAPLFFEDESRQLGSVAIPLPLYRAMHQSPLAIVEMPQEFRVSHILQEYVVDALAEHNEHFGIDGFRRFSEQLTAALQRIRKRLGPERYDKALGYMEQALVTQASSARVDEHEAWISLLLSDYYDPMYEYQLAKHEAPVIMRGSYSDVLEWALSQAPD